MSGLYASLPCHLEKEHVCFGVVTTLTSCPVGRAQGCGEHVLVPLRNLVSASVPCMLAPASCPVGRARGRTLLDLALDYRIESCGAHLSLDPLVDCICVFGIMHSSLRCVGLSPCPVGRAQTWALPCLLSCLCSRGWHKILKTKESAAALCDYHGIAQHRLRGAYLSMM